MKAIVCIRRTVRGCMRLALLVGAAWVAGVSAGAARAEAALAEAALAEGALAEPALAVAALFRAALAGSALAGTALAGAAEDIRDIRGPKAVPAGSWVLPAVLVGAIIAGLCAYAVWRQRHRGANHRALTLSERTLARLEETRPLMLPPTAREFGIAASEVIRNYIEKRFGVIATQRTTEEFLQTLLQSSNETLARHRPLLARFLQQCDFVKFAGASLAAADMESLFQSARGFVLETGEPPAS